MRTRKSLGLLAGLFVAAIITGSILARAQSLPEKTPEDIGAVFASEYGTVQAAEFQSSRSKSEVETAAVDIFLEYFGYPSGMGIEENLEIKATQGLFSGAKGGFSKDGMWDIHNREVWVVVLHDLPPLPIPCGPTPVSCVGQPAPRVSVAVDAETGEILSTELAGNGQSTNPKWIPIMQRIREARESSPIPAAVPTPSPYQTCEIPTPPPPPWVNADGTIDLSKMPDQIPQLDETGNVIGMFQLSRDHDFDPTEPDAEIPPIPVAEGFKVEVIGPE